MAPKKNTQPPRGPEWMERTHERTRDPLPAGSSGDRGAKRWQEAGARFDAELKRGRVPDLPGMPAAGVAGSSGSPSPAPGGGGPADVKRLMTDYARTVLSMKPASLDPFAYTKIIRGRPVQAFVVFLRMRFSSDPHECSFRAGGRKGGQWVKGRWRWKRAEPCAGEPSFSEPCAGDPPLAEPCAGEHLASRDR